VASKDEEFRARAERELAGRDRRTRMVGDEPLDTAAYWKGRSRLPGAVLLDVGERLDWAKAVLGSMKRARVALPVIVATSDQSREFGTKVVSLGVSYILPRDFAPGELAEVFVSLMGSRKPPVNPPADSIPPS